MDMQELLREYYRLKVDGVISQLNALEGAAATWRRVAEEELHGQASAIRKQFGELGSDMEDEFGAEFSLLDTTQRNLSASLAVHVATAVEGMFGSICKRFNLKLPNKATWGDKRNAVENHLKIDCSNLPGFDAATFGRVAGNCFKHGGGQANPEFEKLTGGKVKIGDVIEYEKYPWHDIIEKVSDFLHTLTQKI